MGGFGGIAGRVALVTGAAKGIGAAVVAALAAQGARVAAVDVLADELEKTVALQRENATAFPADITDADAVTELVAKVEAELGPIGILVNVAGVLRTGLVAELTDDDWAATFAVNTTGVFQLSREVTRLMAERGSGAVVLVGSNAAGVPRKGMAAYAASKAAATMFTRCLGLELAGRGIRCNIVSPGSTDTDMQRSLWGPDGSRSVLEGAPADFRVGIPLGRIAEPADIADAVVFLVSDQARHITMHDLYVDGGATLRA